MDIKRCLESATDVERYERLTLQRAVEVEDDLGTCPTAGCPFAFEWDRENRKLECPLCMKSFCLVCRAEPWHRGMRCETYQAERGDPEGGDAAFRAFARSQQLKQCPKCKFWVEKQGGCNAMHCRCNLVFCFQCGGVLKAVANKAGSSTEMRACKCGPQREAELRAHEGAPNHNNPGQPRAGGAAHAGAAAAMAAARAFLGNFVDGGEHDDDFDDDLDDDDW